MIPTGQDSQRIEIAHVLVKILEPYIAHIAKSMKAEEGQ
jgi:hypothetical protein